VSFEVKWTRNSGNEIAKVDWMDFEAAMQAIANPEFVERCAQIVGRTAEMVAELIGEDE